MRALDEYRPLEWALALPLVHGFKRARNVVLERTFRRVRPRTLDRFLAEHSGLAGGTITFTIAYNTPWVIDLLARMAKRHLVADALVVADNSRRPDARREIEALCRTRGVPYIGLPFNPERHPCRSHGIAMNWVYYNIVRALEPRVFAFFDHDLIPLVRLSPAALVERQPFYGVLNHSPWGWNLWAGYCVYDFAAVAPYPLDFNNDNPRKLDTGGRNYLALYRHFDRNALRFPEWVREALVDPLNGGERIVRLIDGAVHVGAASFDSRSPSRPEPAFYQRIVRALEEGATLAGLQPQSKRVAAAP